MSLSPSLLGLYVPWSLCGTHLGNTIAPITPQENAPETARHFWSFGGAPMTSRSAAITLGFGLRADVAQLAERRHGKAEVPGSIPGVGFARGSKLAASRLTSNA